MRRGFGGTKRALLVGVFDDEQFSPALAQELHTVDGTRIAVVSREDDKTVGKVYVGPESAIFLLSLVTGFSAGFAVYAFNGGRENLVSIIAAVLLGALATWMLWLRNQLRLARSLLARFQPLVLEGESLIVVSSRVDKIEQVHNLMTGHESVSKAVFVLQTPRVMGTAEAVLQAAAPLNEESLCSLAVGLAQETSEVNPGPATVGQERSIRECEQTIGMVHERLTRSVHLDQSVALSAEWLLDNTYVVQGHIEDFRANLPKGYYRELPQVAAGQNAGQPRIYVIAKEIVSSWDARISQDSIQTFIQAFQCETVLGSAELWALPLMLRLRLIEHITSLSMTVERRQSESEEAAFWSNRILYSSRQSALRMASILAAVEAEFPAPTGHFVEELVSHLYDEDIASGPAVEWLQDHFDEPLEAVIRADERREAAEQVSLANAISSLRLLSQVDWSEVFEAVSHVEATLCADPVQVYAAMDFTTRDRYRHAIERLSRRIDLSEVEIALKAVERARRGSSFVDRHVGYYLVDEGKFGFERELRVRQAWTTRFRRWVTAHAALTYVSSIVFLTALLLVIAARSVQSEFWLALLAVVLLLFPVSELSVQFVNFVVTRFMQPRPLSKMDFEKGIPDESRTAVVVPMMLLTPAAIETEVDRLEIRALANPDPNLVYCLLADFSDAEEQRMPEDLELLEVAVTRIERLNAEHPDHSFLLLYRERVWSECEQCWIGWERKRGKLEDLNRLLLGEEGAEHRARVAAGGADSLDGVRFVLTLDADTQLPRNSARRLVATISHPLNTPVLSDDGTRLSRGYTIVEPRVSTSLPSAIGSLFARLYTDPAGVDPYTHAVSDVYQDLAGSASFHGKGIYDVAAFHSVTAERIPEEHVLSHDLLEGAHVRCGLASDIELFDQFPQTYERFCARLHRWIRGDWQNKDWLGDRVPGKTGALPNTLGGLDRWKIFDNLRRSLVLPSLLALLLTGLSVPSLFEVGLLFFFLVVSAPLSFALLNRLSRKWLLDSATWSEPLQHMARAVFTIAVLPHQSVVSLDAIGRALNRRRTKRNLLEWSTAKASDEPVGQHPFQQFVLRTSWIPVFALMALIGVSLLHPFGAVVLTPFAALWFAAPWIIHWLDTSKPSARNEELSVSDRAMLRQVARRTWRFYEEFVTEQSHWLPPDNYQDSPREEVAQRTSPTNIGMYLVSALVANDFGYETPAQTIDRARSTLETVGELEHFRGHLLNWYETETLQSLGDKYVSSVDSANYIASLWTVKQGIEDLVERPLLDNRAFEGLYDAAVLMHQELTEVAPEVSRDTSFTELFRILRDKPERLEEIPARLRRVSVLTSLIERRLVPHEGEASSLLREFKAQLDSWIELQQTFLPWVEILVTTPTSGVLVLGTGAHAARRLALEESPSLRMIAEGAVPGILDLLSFKHRVNRAELSQDLVLWLDSLERALESSRNAARRLIDKAKDVVSRIDQIDRDTEFGFLYSEQRRLFSIGYNASHQRLDGSFYDLLASEARITSFVAIAKGEVHSDHWWSLGRPFGRSGLKSVLLSWNGSMFEYLLPLVFTRSYESSLLDSACREAVEEQIAFGKAKRIPWGVSESAFSALDSRHVYQYKAFGVPSLALRRTTREEPVVAPYACALALALAPSAAAANLKRLAVIGSPPMLSRYGFYDAIDYSRLGSPSGERGVVVRTLMAHHQGMVFAAIANAVLDQCVQRKFQADPRVRATLPLLYERVPISPSVVKTHSQEAPRARIAPIVSLPEPGLIRTPDTEVPRTQVLSNGSYSIMVTNAGGGYSRWKDFDVTRWRADTTRDSYGSFCYLRDVRSGLVWSAPHHPVCKKGKAFAATFTVDKASFRRRDRDVETQVEVVVSPDDDAEVRVVTLINHSQEPLEIEATSYIELALAPHLADRSHPAFSKLFVQTEALHDADALLAWRRPRSVEDAPVFAGHLIVCEQFNTSPFEFETSREQFLGRGRSLRDPKALSHGLSGTEGCVLDPVFSVRKSFQLEPGERRQFALVTVAAHSREEAQSLIEKYGNWESISRAVQISWTYAQLELRHLRLKASEAHLYTQLSANLLFPNARLRTSATRIGKNTLGQSALWGHGISGDLPIVAMTIGSREHLRVLQEALMAHDYWRMRGIKCDLVVLNEEIGGYEDPLQREIERTISSRAYTSAVSRPGGVYVLKAAQMSAEETNLVLSCAHMVFVAARGSLSQQFGALPKGKRKKPDHGVNEREPADTVVESVPTQLAMENGYGGFSSDGREYVVVHRDSVKTPRPWSNVIAYENFGCLVTDEGVTCTWSGNSQANRLTQWPNDAVAPEGGEAFYIRDAETGEVWSPTPWPCQARGFYRTYHGQGLSRFALESPGLEHELTVFVARDDPVKVSILTLKNTSGAPRRLDVTHYVEWVLGSDREQTHPHIVTSWDDKTQTTFSKNAYNSDYGSCVAFAAASAGVSGFTCDRAEFLGRNGCGSAPAGLAKDELSGSYGAALDPCSALRVPIHLAPGEQAEIVFVLGEAQNWQQASDFAKRYRDPEAARDELKKVTSYWDDMLSAVQIETPLPQVDLLVNRWLPYQNLSCRIWGRTALYQSGGAYGFRDQLQDVLATLYASRETARAHILRAAARQFSEGDVQHWWHPQNGSGVRTKISDDLLWLPFVVAHYVRVTGDDSILDERVPFLSERELGPDEKEVFTVPAVSGETATVLEHCRRAIERGVTSGVNGLPLIGAGDWNDGLSSVGDEGRGESVWLAWFCIHVLNDFAWLTERRNSDGSTFRETAAQIEANVQEHAWDGEWYLRGFYDDGDPLGSSTSEEAQLDSLPQSWAVICGAADRERALGALHRATERLVWEESGAVLLFDPPFEKTKKEPGYIKAYPPGVRENGGQYTHAALWLAMAWVRANDGDQAVRILEILNPINRSATKELADRYKTEPYVVAADVYSHPSMAGMGGWTWYTGSAAWMYRVWIEEVLGFKLRGDQAWFEPHLPGDWDGFTLTFRFGSSTYVFKVRVHGQGVARSEVLKLVDDGETHEVLVELGAPQLRQSGKT